MAITNPKSAARKSIRKPSARKSKVYTISLPPDLAKQAEDIAKSENRTMSELSREAFRVYQQERTRKWLQGVGEYAATRNPYGYTEKDVPRLAKEVRAENASRTRAQSPGRWMIVVVDSNVSISALPFASKQGIPTRALEKAVDEDMIATCDEIDVE
jgi:predicted transcriptional regulator